MSAVDTELANHRIALLVGGRSTEHDASVHSYLHVLEELEGRADHGLDLQAVYYVDPAGQAFIHRGPPWPRTESDLRAGRLCQLPDLVTELTASGCFVFSVLHGTDGEDGAWQGLAEIADLPGNFGSVFAAAVAMNKWAQGILAKAICPTALELPPSWRVTPRTGRATFEAILRQLGPRPVVIKPNRMGSSLLAERYEGLSPDQLRAQVEQIFPWDAEVLVQAFVDGPEFTCGCLDLDGRTVALPVIEARTGRGFLGHAEKHRKGQAHAILVQEDSGETARVKDVCVRLFDGMGFATMCRFDLIVDPAGTIYFLEANSLPGLMGGSVFPLMLREFGLDLCDLIRLSIRNAARAPRRRKVLRYTIERGGEHGLAEASTPRSASPIA